MKRAAYKLTALLCGVAAALPFMTKYLAVLSWVALIALIYVFLHAQEKSNCSLKQGYSIAFCFFVAFYATVYSFILHMYPMEYAGVTPVFAAIVLLSGLLLMSLLFSSIFSFIGAIFIFLNRKTLFGKYKILSAFLFPALWVIFEWTQTLSWFGVPFAYLAVGQQTILPIIQSASLFGTLFVDFIIVAVSSLLAFSFFYGENLTRKRVFSVLAAAIFIADLLFGMVTVLVSDYKNPANAVRIAAVQGNISSIDERDNMRYEDIRDVYLDICEDAVESGAELIVMPESALPAYFDLNKSRLTTFRKFAMKHNVTILLGGYYKQYHEDGSEAPSNAMYCISPDGNVGEKPYIKRKLVPFGEYIPMRSIIETLLPMLTSINILGQDSGKGEDSALHDTAYGYAASLICYDSVYSSLARDAVKDGAEILTVSTDDSWFNGSHEIYMHLGHSVLRAVENGKYLVRSANTGISAVISPNGEVLNELDERERGFTIADVEFLDDVTLYSVVGDIFVYAVIFYIAVIIAMTVIIGKRTPKKN